MPQLHATAVMLDTGAVLLTGRSGSGKSDLALRLIDRGARLVADDRCDVVGADGELTASPPKQLEGMLEIRGIGILVFAFERSAPVFMVCEMTDRNAVTRLPDADTTEIDGVRLPLFRLDPFDASTPVKLEKAFAMVTGSIGSIA